MIKHTMALALTLAAVTIPAAAQSATLVSLDTSATLWQVQNRTNTNPMLWGPTTNAVTPTTVPNTYNNAQTTIGGTNNIAVGGARWIRPSSAVNEPAPATFAFTRIFSLPATANLASAMLSGKYWSDNGVLSIVLNGFTIFGPAGINQPTTTFSGSGTALNSGSGFFKYNDNELVINVRNDASSPNPVALRVDGDVLGAVPEPGTWMLMLLGFAAIGFAMRSRAKTQVRFQFA